MTVACAHNGAEHANSNRDSSFPFLEEVRTTRPTHYVAKTTNTEAWQLIELKNGKWICDCKISECVHLNATQLHCSTCKLQPEQIDESNLKCRYCGSPDIARCGFRYNSRGIARRYRCNDCLRKFSIRHIQTEVQAKPSEFIWFMSEIGMLTTKLSDLLSELNDHMELIGTATASQFAPDSLEQNGESKKT
jgi:predicted RNA-binding Zn-ribbon protein involved in translation (DUF1610 family)